MPRTRETSGREADLARPYLRLATPKISGVRASARRRILTIAKPAASILWAVWQFRWQPAPNQPHAGREQVLPGSSTERSWASLASGHASVKVDPSFAAVVHTDGYHVFLAPEGDSRAAAPKRTHRPTPPPTDHNLILRHHLEQLVHEGEKGRHCGGRYGLCCTAVVEDEVGARNERGLARVGVPCAEPPDGRQADDPAARAPVGAVQP